MLLNCKFVVAVVIAVAAHEGTGNLGFDEC
jgi:hypothetical protein